mgnify:FL=1
MVAILVHSSGKAIVKARNLTHSHLGHLAYIGNRLVIVTGIDIFEKQIVVTWMTEGDCDKPPVTLFGLDDDIIFSYSR